MSENQTEKAGIRIVYTLERSENDMTIVIVGMRADMEVYREASKRLGAGAVRGRGKAAPRAVDPHGREEKSGE